MESNQYGSRQLNSLLESLHQEKFSGTLHLKAKVEPSNSRAGVLIWREGKIIYGDTKIPSNLEFAKMLGLKFQPNVINAALQVTSQKLTNPTSVREMMEMMVRIRVFQWEAAEEYLLNRVAIFLEKFLPYPGEARKDTSIDFDLTYGDDGHGLNWSELKAKLINRQQQWDKLAPLIPSIEVVPNIPENATKLITDSKVRQHLQKWVDGKRSLVEIAEAVDKDLLQIAQSYSDWIQRGWLSFGKSENQTATSSAKISTPKPPLTKATSTEAKQLPLILSVDDSPIVQTAIKRALSDRYEVVLASKAMDALTILNQKPIQLILLDLTMPDIDGIEFCRTIRKIPKFRDLPIIMLTARDGLIDKMKGHIAGTTKYLTKPFEPEKLQEVVNNYVQVGSL